MKKLYKNILFVKIRKKWMWFMLILLIVLVDQFIKATILHLFQNRQFLGITNFLNLVFVCNHGAAFGFLASAGGWQRWFFTLLGLLTSIFICRILTCRDLCITSCIGLSLVAGGAISNVMDRLVYGCVIDFISLNWKNWYWPAFNVADSAITLGTILLFIQEIRHMHSKY